MACYTIKIIPYDWAIVFQNLLIYRNNTSTSHNNNIRTSSNISVQTQFYLKVIVLTTKNLKQVIKIEELITLFWYLIWELFKPTYLYKTFKVAKSIIADRFILNYTNIDLLAANI